MSELKAYKMVDEKYCTDCLCVIPSEVYLKSEADKVIAHQKFKRCLAMANYWGLVSACTRREIQLKCMHRELKWRKLAEQFKEAK